MRNLLAMFTAAHTQLTARLATSSLKAAHTLHKSGALPFGGRWRAIKTVMSIMPRIP